MYKVKRGNVWYARHDLPEALRPHFGGRARLQAKLGKSERGVRDGEGSVERKYLALKIIWDRQIAEAEGRSTESIIETAEFIRALLERAVSEQEKRAILGLLRDELSERQAAGIERAGGNYLNLEHAKAFDASPEGQKLSQAWGIAQGKFTKIDAHIEPWIASLKRDKDRTKKMKRSTVEGFAKEYLYIEEITRRNIQMWVNKFYAIDDLERPSVDRKLSELRSFRGYCEREGLADVEYNPFKDIKHAKLRKSGEAREAFSSAQVLQLRHEAEKQGKKAVANAIWLGMYTGARLGEICALQAGHVFANYIQIEGGKTRSARRQIPIHPVLAPVLKKIVKASKGGYLIESSAENQYGDRSPAISKAFAHLCDSMGFGREYVFHSIRATFMTELSKAGVEDIPIQILVGHAVNSTMRKHYVKHTEISAKMKIIMKLRYSER